MTGEANNSMKRKLLFVAGSLRLGGIERSLVNLLSCLDPQKYEIDLLLFYPSGAYLSELPAHIRLVDSTRLLRIAGMTRKEAADSRSSIVIGVRNLLALLCRYCGSRRLYRSLFRWVPRLRGYDAAISFSNNVSASTLYFGYNQFVLSKVDARQRIAWVHSDYIRAGLDTSINNEEYRQFDHIVHVSQAGKQCFDQVLPDLQDRTRVIYNTFPVQVIREQAGERTQSIAGPLRLVTVGRIDENKSIDRILRAASRLKGEGFDFEWCIVGDGELRPKLEEEKRRLGLDDLVIFTGSADNPYPMIQSADLFVLASKYEGMPMVVTEALILGTPVVVTRYDSAEEQIQHGVNGLITDNGDEGLYIALLALFQDEAQLRRLQHNALSHEFDNKAVLQQLEALWNE